MHVVSFALGVLCCLRGWGQLAWECRSYVTGPELPVIVSWGAEYRLLSEEWNPIRNNPHKLYCVHLGAPWITSHSTPQDQPGPYLRHCSVLTSIQWRASVTFLFTCMAILLRSLKVLHKEHEFAVSVRVLSVFFLLSGICFINSPGPEEEKLLGSILLPSYKISPCLTEDRVYRKFAFKAEHTNMRTYYFAADTRELMVQWMNALSLASILQEGSRYRTVGVTIIIIV